MNMKDSKNKPQSDLRSTLSAILGLSAFVWAVLTRLDLIDAAFRGIVVYFGVSIMMLVATRAFYAIKTSTEGEEIESPETEAVEAESQAEIHTEPEPSVGANG